MNEQKLILIANPAAGRGRLHSEWETDIKPELQKILGPFTTHFTSGPGQAKALACKAFSAGATLVVSMVGDGTLNEVVNGYFRGGRPINPKAEIGILPFGSGGDFIRSTAIEKDYRKAARRLVQGKAHVGEGGKGALGGRRPGLMRKEGPTSWGRYRVLEPVRVLEWVWAVPAL